MTLTEIMELDREYLLPREVAEIMGCDAQDVRVAARQRPDLLGFPVCIVGTRTKIPKRAFIRWMTGETEDTE